MGKTFKARVFRNIVLLVLIVSCSFAFFYASRQKKLLEEEHIHHGLSIVKMLTGSLKLGLFTESEEFLREPMAWVLEQDEVLQIAVYRDDGGLVRLEGKKEIKELKNSDEVIALLRKNASPVYFNGRYHSEFWVPVFHSESRISEGDFFPEPTGEKILLGFARLSLSREHLLGAAKSIIAGTLAATIMFIFIGGLFSYYIATRITTPLSGFVNEIRTMEKEGIKAVPLKGDAEITELANAFNAMAEALKEKEAEKQKAQEERQKVERMYYQTQRLEALGRLAGGIAHDFNNILTVILNNIELARMKAPESISNHIENAAEAINRGKEIIERLLYAYREMPSSLKPLDLGQIARETVRLLSRDSDEKTKTSIDLMPGLWNVYGDPVQLQQIVMNLYINATDAIRSLMERENREFLISLEADNVEVSEEYTKGHPQATAGEFVKLTVTDNGCGMDEETASRIFEPFFSTKGSSGIGLATVSGIVQQHGGWIDVDSNLGTGTTFRIYFPRWKGDRLIEKAPLLETPPGGSETILLVDDEHAIADAAREMLEYLGYTVLLAYSGEEALKIYKEKAESIDLVVLDVVLPELSGLAVLRQIKEINPEAKVILNSGTIWQLPEEIISGVEAAISKPYKLDELAFKIRDVLGSEKSRSMRQHLSKVKAYYVREKTVPYSGDCLTSSETVYKLFGHLADEPRENFTVLFLDTQRSIIAYEELGKGTLNETAVYPQEVVRSALFNNADSIIIVHNHPSGEITPSSYDIALTSDIMKACKLLNINLADHLIIGKGGYFSFAGNGLL